MIYNWLYDFRMKTMFGRHHDLVNRLCLKWSRMCSVYRHHNTVLFSFMTNHRVCNKSNTTGVTFRAETPYPDFTPIFNGVRVAQSLDRRFSFFLSLCCLSFELRTASDYPFGISKRFIHMTILIVTLLINVKCKTAINALLCYLNLCLNVVLDSLSCSFTSIPYSFLLGTVIVAIVC